MAIDYSQIEGLIRRQSSHHPVVSLYLNVTPPRDVATKLTSLLHAASVELGQREDYSEDQLRDIDHVFDMLKDRVRHAASFERTRLLVIFASGDGLWREFQLPIALPSLMIVENVPYVRPLTMLLDEFERYGVVVTDSAKARIFILSMGDLEEDSDVFIQSEVPDRVNVKASMTGDPATGVRGGDAPYRSASHRST